MATFEITAPDGSIYNIDGETEAGAVAALKKHLNPAAFGSSSLGVLKAAGVGLAKGALGMAEFPARMGHWLAEKAVGGIDYMAGVDPAETERRRAAANETINQDTFNPVNLRRNVESLTGPFRTPQNVPEQFADTVGQFLAAAPIGGAAGMGAKLVGATAGGLLSEAGGQAAQKLMPEAEPYARLAGGLLGAGAPALLRRAVTPLPLSPERQGLLSTLKNEGVDLTAGQATGSQTLRYAESELGGAKGANMMERQGEQFTRAALKRAGIDADRATPEVMDRAFTRIGNEFDGLAARNSLPPDAKIATDVAAHVTDYANLVPPAARAPAVQKLATDMLGIAQNGMSGQAYQSIRSRLERMAKSSKADPQLSETLRNMRVSLDDAMERHLAATNSPDLGAWRTVRNQYRNIIVLEKAATTAGEKAAEGIIAPTSLRNATVQEHGRRSYARGKGDFADLARAGEATMKPLPQSGTAPRTAVRAMGASIPTLLGAALGSTSGAPGIVLGGMAGAALPFAIGRGLLSSPARKYLTNQLLGPGKLTLRQRGALGLLGSAPQLSNSNR